MSNLILTVGLPRSGKSTWARETLYPMVNPDSIRLAIHGQRYISSAEPFVWATAEAMIKALFLAGHNAVILDATNVTVKRRQRWASKEWKTYLKLFPADRAVCIERARKMDDMEIIPIIERMAQDFEPLTAGEIEWQWGG